MSFVCKLTFTNTAQDPLTHSTYSKVVDLLSLGSFKWQRNLNKNSIYVQLPVETGDEGGYGYDLGFVQDDYVFELVFKNYNEYRRLMALIKTNVGEVAGELKIGYTGTVDTYNYIVRYCNSSGDDGGGHIKLSLTLTIVSKEYNNG